MNDVLLRVEGLSKTFGSGRRAHQALDDVSFELRQGEILGLVGESGSGKSTIIRCLVGLEKESSGSIRYQGINPAAASKSELHRYRRDLQMVFQDPYSSLDPRMTVRRIIEEPMLVMGGYSERERRERIHELIRLVGLRDEHLDRYPRDFSGGQRQRIAIVRALVVEPKVLLCDEPVSALDVSVQAQVLNLLKDMQRQLDLTVLFVSHDLAVVKYLCTRLVVLNRGRVAEKGSVPEIYENPQDAYTKALLEAVPVPNPAAERERRARRLGLAVAR
ncbi:MULTISPECIES: ATP-binding cassette domain-containing protein [Arthrobacter]|uniref:ABC transporter ATP-binding protein n=1 Tax=Arthrobacter terricola TaxID=2547396 RepID=A0A4R5KHQ6_9MICC|nr:MULTISPECIES: ATP-binding cassette domain-containing protein [Arthrobacter]MBT8162005.1 ATP-binding cassette domain-containing protein [Arthrobacter sp. GN70]TDF94602.1 ABC transporter ATP-binding protein [Arthrobacter terricola]